MKNKTGYRGTYIAILLGMLLCAGIFFLMQRKADFATGELVENKSRLRVGVLLNGGKDGNGWNKSHMDGFDAAAKELGLEIICRENVTDEKVYVIAKELVAQDCHQIFACSSGFGSGIRRAAAEHRGRAFFHLAGESSDENISTLFARMYQVRYLAGMAAALQSRTNHLGFVGAWPVPEVLRNANAFALGARSVNPDAVVHVRWTEGWNKPERERELAAELVEKYNVDVLTCHQNGTTVDEVAAEKGIWSIGFHYDNMAKFPNSMLTAAVWNWRDIYISEIRECLEGKFVPSEKWVNVTAQEDSAVKLLPLNRRIARPEIEKRMEPVLKRMADMEWDVFYGPVRDQQGRLRVAEGENVMDVTLLARMDWLVEGIEGQPWVRGDKNAK